MELIAPAGNLKKLKFAFLYGADAVYLGFEGFSLRAKADNFTLNDLNLISSIKEKKKVYAAFNIFFQPADLVKLERLLVRIDPQAVDAFIISDLGVLKIFQKYFPKHPLHLSTQANCTNQLAAKIYEDLGFSRLILARELSLEEIAEIKSKTRLEIEIFVHGAMCLAYAGRCLLSAYLAGRSANRGNCAHACRWNYQLLEEERPGEYLPVIEGENFTSILSSKDLCLFDHLPVLAQVGVDALKIEGRMKSVYYVAQTTKAYRQALNKLYYNTNVDLTAYRQELYKVSHREFSTGFLFNKKEIEEPTFQSYKRDYLFVGIIEKKVSSNLFELTLKNKITVDEPIEYIGFDLNEVYLLDDKFNLYNKSLQPVSALNHNEKGFLKTSKLLKEGYLIRKRLS